MENITVKKKEKKKKVSKSKVIKSFRAQVNCTCNRNCADLIDVVKQKDIFDQFNGYASWSEKTKFLRSIAKREPVKENLNPRVNLKKRDFFSIICLPDANDEQQRVCASFATNLLQINRHKLFRAGSSVKNNPFAIDRRGKARNLKTTTEDTTFVKHFIQSIPQYESEIGSNPSRTKYLHPNLTVNAVYRLYENMCEFKQKEKLSKSGFTKIFKTNFSHLQPFKPQKSQCAICKSNNEQKKIKVLSPAALENIQEQEDAHFMQLKQLKNELIDSICEPEFGVEIFAFELQRPLPMPSLPTDESYDLRCLWFSNLCVFDELRKTPYMYVWDETTAKRGPEEIASVLYKHITDTISKTTTKIILYSDSTDLYRNLQIAVMLGKIFDYNNSELQSIEHRFFIPGHNTNDCNRTFETLEKKIKSSQSLFTPDDWVQLISSAKQAKQNFNVHKMSIKDFLSVELLTAQIIAEEINWTDVKAIILSRLEPLNMRLKYFSQDVEKIVPLYTDNCGQLLFYKNQYEIAICKAKYDDLMTKTMKYIPQEKQAYYQNIQHDVNLKDEDFALASYNL